MKLEQRLRNQLRMEGKTKDTADCYWRWIVKFMEFAKAKRGEWVDPKNMGRHQVEVFLTHLATKEHVAPSTQNQALSALCYLYNIVLGQKLENVNAMRAKKAVILRQVLDQSEVLALFNELSGQSLLAAKMMYASSFRIGEIGRLRMKDIDFKRSQIYVQDSKHGKSRMVGFPVSLHDAVHRQMESMRVLWKYDVAQSMNGVSLPYAWGRKSPSSHLDFLWWYLFAAERYSKCPDSGKLLRHHADMGNIGRNISQAAKRAGITKRITSHCLRHSWVTHSLEGNVPIHVVKELAGHNSLETTAGYAHMRKDGATATPSPIDALATLLANPSAVQDLRRDDDEPPMLRVFVG